MVSDMMTKGLTAERFEKLQVLAGVKELNQQSNLN